MKLKTILIAGGAAIGVASYIAWNKIQVMKAVFDQMTIKPSGISNLVITLSSISFKLDIKITNPTVENFAVSGGSLAKVKRIIVYRNGHLLGTGYLDIDGIEIPPMSSVELKYIPFEVALEQVMYNLLQMESFSLAQLTIVGVVEVLGKEYYIEG